MGAPETSLLKRIATDGAFGRFLLVGISNTLITFAVYEVLLFVADYQTAFTISFVTGLVFTALLNVRVVFAKKLHPITVTTFAVYYLAYYFVNMAALYLVVDIAGVPEAIAPVLTLIVLTPLNFLCARQVIGRADAWARRIAHR
jgi:putative flippase GtrA